MKTMGNNEIFELSWAERNSIGFDEKFSFDLRRNLDDVKGRVRYWNELLEPKKEISEQPQNQS